MADGSLRFEIDTNDTAASGAAKDVAAHPADSIEQGELPRSLQDVVDALRKEMRGRVIRPVLNHVQLGKWCFRNETQAGQGRAAKLY